MAPGQASPVHFVDTHSEWKENCAESLLEVITVWNQLLDDGHWLYDPMERNWDQTRLQGVPRELLVRHLG